MAVAVIARVLMGLLQRHGVSRGLKVAQKLGFKNKDIKKAFINLNTEQRKIGLKEFKRKPRSTFAERKGERSSRVADRQWESSVDDFYTGEF